MAYILKAIGEYYNNALIIVEINNAGILTNSTLDDIYQCGNLYEWEYFNRRKPLKGGQTGWQTSNETKRLLIGQANSLLSMDPPGVEINSPTLLNQMKNYIDFGNDVFQPAKGWRGDRVIGWLLAVMAMWRKIARYEAYSDPFTKKEEKKVNTNYKSAYRDDEELGGGDIDERDWRML